MERGEYASAITAFSQAVNAAPAEAAVALLLANAHRLAGDRASTRRVLLRASETPSADPVALHALGAALLDAGAPAEAAECFALVLRSRPRDPAALAALAGASRAMGAADQAWPRIQQALRISPNHPVFLLTAAQVRHDLGDLRGAMRWLDAAEAARPGHAPTALQRAYTTLMSGASTEGWRLFESRALPIPPTAASRWDGNPVPPGASLLVTAEQGVGDQFQFLRFVSVLKKYDFSRILVECHADAVSLLALNGVNAVPRGSAVATDFHVPLLSLPFVLDVGGDVLSGAVPYLRAPIAGAAPLLGPTTSGTLRLGVVWAGNPDFAGRVTRDLDPSLLPHVFGIPGISWVSLQQGDAAATLPDGVVRLPPLPDWAATASVLAQLDGLVTTDTGIAHLAGALGVPTWVLLQRVPDWRWGLDGPATLWYPTLRLMRQERVRDWRSVLSRLGDDLAQHRARSAPE